MNRYFESNDLNFYYSTLYLTNPHSGSIEPYVTFIFTLKVMPTPLLESELFDYTKSSIYESFLVCDVLEA